jgi:hypothetical protein
MKAKTTKRRSERVQNDPYVIAGVNLRPFVLEWLADLNSGGGIMRGLLKAGTRYSYSGHMMMANIAPRADPDDARPEITLLYAVMATYQQAGWPGADPERFDGFTPHVERAFDYFHTVGEAEAARRITADVIKQMAPGPDAWEMLTGRQRVKNPAEDAYWDRKMAEIYQRDFRAAKLLDPEIDFDAMVLSRGA